MLKKLNNYLPHHSLVTLYKTFIRRHLQYADIIYDKPNNINICIKIESLLYNAALAITGDNRGFQYLSSRRWLRKLCYLYNYVSTVNQSYQSRSGDKFLFVLNQGMDNSFPEIRKSVSCEVVKKSLLKFLRPSPNNLFHVSDSLGIKFLTRLGLGLRYLK